MPLIGNQLASAENNSFRVLDDISNFTLVFDGSSASVVSTSNDTITLFQHPFVTGQRVTYSSGAGTQIGGLTSGSAYFIIKVDSNTFRLSSTLAGSLQNSNLIDLVSVGTGINHSFNVRFDGVNTKFKATYNNGTKCSISRAAQLDIAVNGVVQQPYDSNPPPNGFTIEADATIVFSTAPLAGFTFWGKALTNAIASFETSDNSIDTFTGNGSQKNFTLSKTPANSQNVLVTINGVLQYPSDASATRSYSVNANVLVFDVAPANGSVIQVRFIGFAGPTTSAVTGFYGRVGNVALTSSDGIGVGTAKIGVGTNVGIATALLVEGHARITGILTVGTSSITLDGNNDRITVGPSFLSANSVGLGVTTTAGRNAGVNTATGTVVYNSSTQILEFYTGNQWVSSNVSQFIQATGGTISNFDSGGVSWRAHTFNSSGTLIVTAAPQTATIEYLIVAGGGGGGFNAGCGGGAGGFRTGTGFPVVAGQTYTITVGAGGNGSSNDTANGIIPGFTSQGNATNGAPSSIIGVTSITSHGGGWGGSSNSAGNPGGSGGGSAVNLPAGTGNSPPVSPSQGNPGGTGNTSDGSTRAGGGGGGAGAAGNGTTNSNLGGSGGAGLPSSISGSSVTYSGGGGGSSHTGGPTAIAPGGAGGGGAGGAGTWPSPSPGTAGSTNTGGGGGAGSGGSGNGGAGGSGIVIVRYQVGQLATKATGGTISYAGGKTIHTFNTSSTFTVLDSGLTSVDYLVVAGGGGGGTRNGGGGGAGGFRTGTSFPVNISPGVYTITVGSGGAGAPAAVNTNSGGQGTDSIFSSITAAGGGSGGGATISGGSGGSGGGCGNGAPTATPAGNTPATTPSQGNPGGAGQPGGNGTGGGGAGGAGSTANPAPSGSAGAGGPGTVSSISGSPVTYAGGGGGGGFPGSNGAGGPGGGGAGGGGSQGSGGLGTINTGGGGGGGSQSPGANAAGGSGGSGIVIISYPS